MKCFFDFYMSPGWFLEVPKVSVGLVRFRQVPSVASAVVPEVPMWWLRLPNIRRRQLRIERRTK